MKKYRKTYWGAIPKAFKAHDKVTFKRFGRRSNWTAATSILGLKGGACAKTLFFSMFARTVRDNPDLFADIEPVSINWSERFVDENAKTFVVEHGWLPRSSYQVSPLGANARSHTQFDSSLDYIERIGQQDLALCKARAKHFLRPRSLDIDDLTKKPFCLLPLQGGEDYNLKFSDSGFEHFYGQKGANDLLAQALIDRSYSEAQGVNIIVTEHPAKKCRLSTAPSLPSGVTFIGAQKGIRSIDLVAHPNCQGLVSVNSNMVHEAMVLGKPVCTYGRLMYPNDDKPMFSSIADMLKGDEKVLSLADQYLALLFLSQWELADLMDPVILRAFLSMEKHDVPWMIRKTV